MENSGWAASAETSAASTLAAYASAAVPSVAVIVVVATSESGTLTGPVQIIKPPSRRVSVTARTVVVASVIVDVEVKSVELVVDIEVSIGVVELESSAETSALNDIKTEKKITEKTNNFEKRFDVILNFHCFSYLHSTASPG